MPDFEQSRKLLNLLMEYERSIHELYSVYAVRLPGHEAFWKKLSEEELLHARSVEVIAKAAERGTIVVNRDAFKIPAVQSALNFLKNEIKEAATAPLSQLSALAIAVSIEQSIIDHKFYALLPQDHPKTKRIFEALHDEAVRHRGEIERLWNEAKKIVVTEVHPTG